MSLPSKMRIWLCAALFAVILSSCGREDPYRVDTVVRIPVNPTQAAQTEATEPVPTETEVTETTQPAETIPETSPETQATEPPKSKPSGGRKPSGSGGTSSPKPSEPQQTQPPVTEPPATEQPETQPATEIPETQPPYDPSSYSVGSLEYAILDKLNAYRAEAGLPALTLSRKLCGIAGLRAREASELWSHTRPDGRSYTTAMSDYGYGYGASAENLAYAAGSGNAAAIVAEWMEAGNRDSILSSAFTTAGIGVYSSGGVLYIANILVG